MTQTERQDARLLLSRLAASYKIIYEPGLTPVTADMIQNVSNVMFKAVAEGLMLLLIISLAEPEEPSTDVNSIPPLPPILTIHSNPTQENPS